MAIRDGSSSALVAVSRPFASPVDVIDDEVDVGTR
jgi:hypothetical protein